MAVNQPMKLLPLMMRRAGESVRCDLDIVEGDEGADEPVDPDPVVPTDGAN
jgi:hypothetical protein